MYSAILRPLSPAAWCLAIVGLLSLASPSLATATEPSVAPAIERVDTTFQSVDATISAQWEFPTRTPAPLVVILPASETVDRDGLPNGYSEPASTGIYAQFAKQLVQAGFAVFRFDSAGTGRSSKGQYATVRSTALEAYSRAIDHPKVDRDHVFLLGHSASTDSVAGIYPRYEALCPLDGIILLSSIVDQTVIVQLLAPTLLVVSDKTPEDFYEHGQFPADARSRSKDPKLETSLVVVPGADETLLFQIGGEGDKKLYSLHPRAVQATLEWLRAQLGLPIKS